MAERKRLPSTRLSVTAKFSFGKDSPNFYAIVGLFDDGLPGELFLRMGHVGGIERGVLDALATMVSMGLQHGVPLETICQKLEKTRYEPMGIVQGPPGVKMATSIGDALAQWFRARWIDRESPQFWPGSASHFLSRRTSEGGGAR